MSIIEQARIKDEVVIDDYVLAEEEIKVEEPRLQDYDGGPVIAPPSVIVQKHLSFCSMCKQAFERRRSVKIRNKADFSKCNKCILHSRLSVVFSSTSLRTICKNQSKDRRRSKIKDENNDDITMVEGHTDDVIMVEDDRKPGHDVLINKVMFLCMTCQNPFERNQPIRISEQSDWYRCNKCILHSRLSAVFNTQGKSIQSVPRID